ncbi:MAG: exo-beta-N-acetylmuramidase NamZ family protein [Chitinophagales bacterium]
MKSIYLVYLLISVLASCLSTKKNIDTQHIDAQTDTIVTLTKNTPNNSQAFMPDIVLGAERFAEYERFLANKSVALVVNQTSMVGDTHLVDILLSKGIAIKTVFAPEHGFRGKADAGAHVSDSKDAKTGLPIVSLYGKNKKPSAEQLANIDVVIFDIQDVGARFYTYISTMHYVMEACAENDKKVLVLDRPNPNGHYVDGPVLDLKFQSFVGMHPIPIVHGMTVGELAQMINAEAWLKGGVRCDLKVVPCLNYTHKTPYELPIKPSPNLPNLRSIYLYPSLCLFEPTVVSIGRGTDKQFQVVGSPTKNEQATFSFTPVSKEGAKYPKHENKICYGQDFSSSATEDFRKNQLNLSWLIAFYTHANDKKGFFTSPDFFNKLAGNAVLKEQIKVGLPESQIRQTWQAKLQIFKDKRKKYLLYADFE